ncbi:MAG: hypothetical protein OXG07_00420 [Anaerolineaceae bacterium]|nr:hypothetical protein [Anaerolineaceae bacterium]
MNDTNYDEALVPDYELPPLLRLADGSPVRDADTWREQRRPQLLALFAQQVYGQTPVQNLPLHLETLEETALPGGAERRQLRLLIDGAHSLHLLLWLPRRRPAPLFLGLNFNGNHTTHPDPGILAPSGVAAARGSNAGRWPVEDILARGYGLATLCCDDLYPDRVDGRADSVQRLFEAPGDEGGAWGAVATWAWGLSRALDALLETGDCGPVALIGHSRLGKTALWAAARDERFAFAVSNNSGCAGAALSRRRFGETLAAINTRFPHWFCRNFHAWNEREHELPFDQHMLLALIAPRPLYVASASDDLWADPRGEFLATLAVSPVWQLMGHEGLPVRVQPAPDTAVAGRVGYHLRRGGHDITAWDWQRYLDFADAQLR